ncbi:class I SAM-dependent methyltransferase [Leptolyngbya sp. CCNP1308]|uniref:class I SAM-dependent methyltransferase n=1 Tax=Leptolyngbya sp. CCNP1308 TaxID=3110255 RepID=UPI002B2162A3|nr:class I SAM-dependent methyltransferase [Leptolyngbya sp. CCNP1308]MEA5448229.1 class I SAM-dependent methyltransferase [Leptolyngbya sp. CCNP1308]
MSPLKTNYMAHDSVYQRLRAEGAFGWTSESDQTQVVQPRILQAIARLALAPGSRILDLGCGTGDIAIWLASLGYAAYGIDIAPSAIAWAEEKARSQAVQVEFTVGSVVELSPYPNGFFHLVIDGRCLHCIIGPDRSRTLASIYRVLQPGGGFLLQSMCGEVMEASPMRQAFDPASHCLVNEQGIATRYIGPVEAILQELKTAGLETSLPGERAAIASWHVVPREGPHDQDDLVALAVKLEAS